MYNKDGSSGAAINPVPNKPPRFCGRKATLYIFFFFCGPKGHTLILVIANPKLPEIMLSLSNQKRKNSQMNLMIFFKFENFYILV